LRSFYHLHLWDHDQSDLEAASARREALERFVDKLRTLLALFWTLIGVLVLYAISAALLYQFGVEQYATSIRR
jgi:hypothetical protein